MPDEFETKNNTLWTPWRMGFIRSHKEDDACFLCQAATAKGEELNKHSVLLQGKNSFACLNIYPYNNGHLLIAPKEHTAELGLLDDETQLEIIHLISLFQGIIKETMNPGGFNVGLNQGQAAGAGVPGHLHWHLVPRWSGDTNFMPVLAGAKTIPQSLTELYAMLYTKLKEKGAGEKYTLPPHEKWMEENGKWRMENGE